MIGKRGKKKMHGEVAQINVLKAFFIITKDRIYFSKKYNYDNDAILQENNFESWKDLHDRGGFSCFQFRPKGERTLDRKTGIMTEGWCMNYSQPFDLWKLSLRYSPWPPPDWLHIGAARLHCLALLPEWASYHIVREGVATCGRGQAIVAIGNSRLIQTGGICWVCHDSRIEQQPGCKGIANLHDRARGLIYSQGKAFDQSHAEVFPGGECQAYDSATVNQIPGPEPEHRPAVEQMPVGHNLPFNAPVE
jgi:hypothetical protein